MKPNVPTSILEKKLKTAWERTILGKHCIVLVMGRASRLTATRSHVSQPELTQVCMLYSPGDRPPMLLS